MLSQTKESWMTFKQFSKALLNMLFVKWHLAILNMLRAQWCSIHLSAHMNGLVSQLLDSTRTDRFLSKLSMQQFVALCVSTANYGEIGDSMQSWTELQTGISFFCLYKLDGNCKKCRKSSCMWNYIPSILHFVCCQLADVLCNLRHLSGGTCIWLL